MGTKLIGVKYCGGCNPTIDRVGLVDEIQRLLPEGYKITHDASLAPWETAIMMCGCVSACIDKPEVRNLARRWIVIAGNNVDSFGVPDQDMARTVTEKIIKLS